MRAELAATDSKLRTNKIMRKIPFYQKKQPSSYRRRNANGLCSFAEINILTDELSFHGLVRVLRAKYNERLVGLFLPKGHYDRCHGMCTRDGHLEVFWGRSGTNERAMHIHATGGLAKYLKKFLRDNKVKHITIRNALCLDMLSINNANFNRHVQEEARNFVRPRQVNPINSMKSQWSHL